MRRWTVLALVASAFLAGELFLRLGWLGFMERWQYDLFHHAAGFRGPATHVAIVSVDDETLLHHRDEPMVFWGPHFAKAMEVLRSVGVKVIGLDYLFSVSPESWLKKMGLPYELSSRTYDVPMRQQLSRGSVILIGVLAATKEEHGEILLPVEDYIFSLPNGLGDVGLANFLSDPDGVVRNFIPQLLEDDTLPNLSFGTLLAMRASGLDPGAEFWNLGPRVLPRKSQPIPIRFVGPPGSIMRVSMARVLAPGAEQDPQVQALKGRIVIVAAEHVGLQDLHPTPYSRGGLLAQSKMMSGAEIHANICETILGKRFPQEVPESVRMLLAALFVGFGCLCFLRLDPWKGFLALVLISLGSWVISYVFFLWDGILALSGAQISTGLCFLGGLGLRLRGVERERQKLKALFGRYVSQEVVEKLLYSGHRPQLGGEAMEVTVLFSDIRGFTRISEMLTAQEVVELLNAFLSRACQAVLEEGGMVDKYVGDSVMAVFGWPVPHRDHAARAMRAAQKIVRAAREMDEWMRGRFAGRGLPAFRVGVGLHTGPAVLGNIGSPQRMDFTAVGDTVNTASRLEGLSKELSWSIVASEATFEAGGEGFVVEGETVVNLRGKAAPVKVYGVATS
ncbi:MAG: adenylate/guanylate cyclase domain-containing protein [bacterium]